MLELRHYRYVIAVADERSFTKAAAILGVSTPTLSVQIKHVEDSIGALIFNRTSRSAVTRTPDDRAALLEMVESIIRD
ncbi:LysR family transcriptional regulator [Rhizobium rhizogenes]|uniref:LysR family transcriptional regulator n=1 Tax=Rhizobium rhizogenes TaxID=359 RepID=UPI00157458FB|nr:LysR family transcriptional regulator [Rhizobium rhizogenes]NTI78447.1 LysR family transcriptional regulator [Rhizobium rhizogenes]